MKIISLNTWGGRLKEPLESFLTNNLDVDIFCFQEMYSNADGKDTIWTNGTNLDLYTDIKNILPQHYALFHPHLGDWWGLALFVKKDVHIISEGEVYVHKENGWNTDLEVIGHTAKNVQYITFEKEHKKITVCNFHGLWNGEGKTDTEDRINQSKKIVSFLKTLNTEIILCGDFNLAPDTESLLLIEKELNVRNLVKDFNILSTRTSYYTKDGKFADYILISSGINVKEFKVLPDEVSDHAPLYLEIE